MRWSWINFRCRGVLLVWIKVEQGPTALAVGAGGGCLDIFTLIYHFSFLSPSLWETTRYRLKYCLKGPLSQKPTNQPTNYTEIVIYYLLCVYCVNIKKSVIRDHCAASLGIPYTHERYLCSHHHIMHTNE